MRALDTATLSAAIRDHALVVQPWSPAAALLDGVEARATDAHSIEPLDALVAELLCTASLVLEIGVIHEGAITHLRWLHDGRTAVLVNLGLEPCVSDPLPVAQLIERLVAEAEHGVDGELAEDAAAVQGGLVLRPVHLGPAGATTGPLIELIGPPGHRAMVVRGAEERLLAVDLDEIRALLRLVCLDADLALEAEDTTYSIGRAEFAALAVQLGRGSLVELVTDDLDELDNLLGVGMTALEADPDAAALVSLLAVSDEELRCVLATRDETQVILCDLDPVFGALVTRTSHGFDLVETTRSGALASLRSTLDSVGTPAVLQLTRTDVHEGIRIAASLQHDGRQWLDPDGGDPQESLDLLLRVRAPVPRASFGR